MHFKKQFIPVMAKLNFQHPVFSVTWFLIPEIILICWFDVQETLLLLLISENSWVA